MSELRSGFGYDYPPEAAVWCVVIVEAESVAVVVDFEDGPGFGYAVPIPEVAFVISPYVVAVFFLEFVDTFFHAPYFLPMCRSFGVSGCKVG